eukprot:scaffold15380_cov117-Isochrysis_galbana.AAC.3
MYLSHMAGTRSQSGERAVKCSWEHADGPRCIRRAVRARHAKTAASGGLKPQRCGRTSSSASSRTPFATTM